MLDWLNDVMEERFIPSKVIEAMQLDAVRIELGVERYMGIVSHGIDMQCISGKNIYQIQPSIL